MPSHLLEHVPPLLLNLSPLTYLILSPQRHLLRLYSFFDGPACFATFQTIERAELLQILNSAQMCQQNKKLKVRATTSSADQMPWQQHICCCGHVCVPLQTAAGPGEYRPHPYHKTVWTEASRTFCKAWDGIVGSTVSSR